MNNEWRLLHNYKDNDSSTTPQLPSQMRINQSPDKRLWKEGEIQRDPKIGIESWHQHRYHLGHDLRGHPEFP